MKVERPDAVFENPPVIVEYTPLAVLPQPARAAEQAAEAQFPTPHRTDEQVPESSTITAAPPAAGVYPMSCPFADAQTAQPEAMHAVNSEQVAQRLLV